MSPHLPDPLAGAQLTVGVPKDAALRSLLTGSGGPAERLVNTLANSADPDNRGSSVVTFWNGDHVRVAEDLAGLYERARRDGHPAAELLPDILRQLGHLVPAAAPEPAAEPAPAAARVPKPPPRPAS